MAEPILGEALALQSNFQPDTTPLLTRSLMRAEEMDLKRAINAQKQLEAEQKAKAQIARSINFTDPKVGLRFIPKVREVVTNATYDLMNTQDPYESLRKKKDTEIELTRIEQLYGATDKRVENLVTQGHILPKKLAEGVIRSDDKMIEEARDYNLLFPYYNIEKDPEYGIPVVAIGQAPPKRVENRNKLYQDYIGEALQSMQMRRTGDRVYNKDITKAQLNDLDFRRIARNSVNDESLLATVLSENEELAMQMLRDKLAKLPKGTTDETGEILQGIRQEIGAELAYQELKGQYATKFGVLAKPSESNFQFDFSGGANINGKYFNPSEETLVKYDDEDKLRAAVELGVFDQKTLDIAKQTNDPKLLNVLKKRAENVQLIGVTPANVSVNNIKDAQGKIRKLDAISIVYRPSVAVDKGSVKEGEWFITGSEEIKDRDKTIKKSVFLPLDEVTEPQMQSIFKVSKNDFQNILTNRLRAAGMGNYRYSTKSKGNTRISQKKNVSSQPQKTTPTVRGGNVR